MVIIKKWLRAWYQWKKKIYKQSTFPLTQGTKRKRERKEQNLNVKKKNSNVQQRAYNKKSKLVRKTKWNICNSSRICICILFITYLLN